MKPFFFGLGDAHPRPPGQIVLFLCGGVSGQMEPGQRALLGWLSLAVPEPLRGPGTDLTWLADRYVRREIL